MGDQQFVGIRDLLYSLGSPSEREAYARALSDPDVLSPEWDKALRVHDWRNYVSRQLKMVWKEIPFGIRVLIYMQAEGQASNEEWD